MKYVIKVHNVTFLAEIVAELGEIGKALTLYRSFPLMASGELPDDVAHRLHNDVRVTYVEADNKRVDMQTLPRPSESVYKVSFDSIQAMSSAMPNTPQSGAGAYIGTPPFSMAWHLPYMSRRIPNLNSTDTDLSFSSTRSGIGVNIYVVDSGIRYTHFDFLNHDATTSRAHPLPGYTDPFGTNGTDANGHGTTVAGLCGGRISGFARDANIYSARVFGPDGEWGGEIAFIDACDKIIAHKQITGMPGIVNLSLGASPVETFNQQTQQYTINVQFDNPFIQGDHAINDIVREVIAAGLTVVVAAGNGWGSPSRTQVQPGGINASVVIPANVAECITVGAHSITSNIADFSNYGSAVDIFAPGSFIVSGTHFADDKFMFADGTSMAAPCVTSVCALYLEENPSATPNQVVNWVKTVASTSNVVSRTNLAAHTDADPFVRGGITNELRYTNGQSVTYPVDRMSADRIIINPYALGRSAS